MKISKLLICGLLSIAQHTFAETETPALPATTQPAEVFSPSFGLNAEPLWLVLSGIGLKFEYFVTNTVSIGIGGILIPNHKVETTSTNTLTTDTYNWEHNEGFIGSNIMLTGTFGSHGLYINPAIGFIETKITNYSSLNLIGSSSSPAARLTVGYQWILAKHLRLAAGGGLSLAQNTNVIVKDSNGVEVLNEKNSGLGGLAIDLQIGYVF